MRPSPSKSARRTSSRAVSPAPVAIWPRGSQEMDREWEVGLLDVGRLSQAVREPLDEMWTRSARPSPSRSAKRMPSWSDMRGEAMRAGGRNFRGDFEEEDRSLRLTEMELLGWRRRRSAWPLPVRSATRTLSGEMLSFPERTNSGIVTEDCLDQAIGAAGSGNGFGKLRNGSKP